MNSSFSQRTLPYLSGRFFDGISSGLFMMALPWIMLQSPNMGPFVAMVALGCTAVSFVLAPIFATLIDRHSRKALLIYVQATQLTTATVVALVYWFGDGSHWLLALAQLLFWTSSNLGWSTNNAFTQENCQANEYAKISGQQEIILQATTLGAGGLGVILLAHWGMFEFALFASVAAALGLISYIVTPYQRKLSHSTREGFVQQLVQSRDIFAKQPRFYAFILLSCLSYPVVTYLGKLIPVWFAEQGISGDWFAGYNIAFGVGSLLTGLVVSRVLERFEHAQIITYAIGVLALSLLAMAFTPSPQWMILLTIVFAGANALNRIARTNWMHHTIAIQQRGRVDGGLQLFATMVQSLSYVLIALLSHYGVTHWGFLLIASIMLLVFVKMWKMQYRGVVPLSAQTA